MPISFPLSPGFGRTGERRMSNATRTSCIWMETEPCFQSTATSAGRSWPPPHPGSVPCSSPDCEDSHGYSSQERGRSPKAGLDASFWPDVTSPAWIYGWISRTPAGLLWLSGLESSLGFSGPLGAATGSCKCLWCPNSVSKSDAIPPSRSRPGLVQTRHECTSRSPPASSLGGAWGWRSAVVHRWRPLRPESADTGPSGLCRTWWGSAWWSLHSERPRSETDRAGGGRCAEACSPLSGRSRPEPEASEGKEAIWWASDLQQEQDDPEPVEPTARFSNEAGSRRPWLQSFTIQAFTSAGKKQTLSLILIFDIFLVSVFI